MIKGINGQPYIDLDSYIDVDGFVNLHAEMSKGIVLSKYKKEGNILKPSGAMEPGSWTAHFKPSCVALEEYYKLPEDDPIRQAGRELGEMDNRDQFIQYLKLTMGAYDAYQFVFLKTEEGGWDSRFDQKEWTPDAVHFPNLKLWLENLVTTGIFTHLGRILFFKQEHDCVPVCHRDLYGTELGIHGYSTHRNEFIHITPNSQKQLYLWNPETNEKVHIPSRACWFNDSDWHGSEKTNTQAYGLRIDGRFTEDFRRQLGIDHLDSY